MKKNKFAKLLKIGFLFFGISLMLFNCEKETYLPIEQSENLQTFTPTFKIISKEVLNKEGAKELDVRIHESVTELTDLEINSISIPLSITDNTMEFSGFRLGHHIRLSKELKQKQKIELE